MAIIKFDHIGLVVRNLDEAMERWARILKVDPKRIIVARNYADKSEGVEDLMDSALIPVGESWLELVAPVTPNGNMAKQLEKRGEGVHHIGLSSDDVVGDWEKQDARRDEFGVIEPKPRVDAYNVSYWYLHPKKWNGVLIEMDCDWRKTSASDFTPMEPTPDWDEVVSAKTAKAK